MVAGDVVAAQAAVGVALTFQPALGVNCLISCCGHSAATWINLTNGANMSGVAVSTAGGVGDTMVYKIFIDNSIYLNLPGVAGKFQAYSGLQIK